MKVTIVNLDKISFDVIDAGSVFYSECSTLKHTMGYFMKTSTNQYNYNAVDVFMGATAYFGDYEEVIPVNAELVIKR